MSIWLELFSFVSGIGLAGFGAFFYLKKNGLPKPAVVNAKTKTLISLERDLADLKKENVSLSSRILNTDTITKELPVFISSGNQEFCLKAIKKYFKKYEKVAQNAEEINLMFWYGDSYCYNDVAADEKKKLDRRVKNNGYPYSLRNTFDWDTACEAEPILSKRSNRGFYFKIIATLYLKNEEVQEPQIKEIPRLVFVPCKDNEYLMACAEVVSEIKEEEAELAKEIAATALLEKQKKVSGEMRKTLT